MMSQIIGVRFNTVIILWVFPSLVMAGLLQPTVSRILGSAPFRFFGDISYSMYMIHFSVLLTFHYISVTSTTGPTDFLQKGVFWTYLAIVIGISTLSYKYFEKPAMDKLRQLWREQQTAATAAAGKESVKEGVVATVA